MKKNIITLTIIAIFATTAFSAQVDKIERNRISSQEMASNLIQEFDTDNSTALNQLELSGAITYLRYTRPIVNRRQGSNTVSPDLPNPPKIHHKLRWGYWYAEVQQRSDLHQDEV